MTALAGAGTAVSLAGGSFVTGDGGVHLDPAVSGEFEGVAGNPEAAKQYWLGPGYWGNRLQDWRHDGERLVCLRSTAGNEVRTVGVLTREIVSGDDPGHLRVTTGLAGVRNRAGFCGFLVGVGDNLDYRGRALAQRSSGTGGGMLCTFGMDGRVRFRDHTDEKRSLEFRELPSETHRTLDDPQRPDRDETLELALDVLPRRPGRFDVRLSVHDEFGAYLAGATRRDVPEADLLGGISLVSSPPPNGDGVRWWFGDFETAGRKVAVNPDRTFGPVAGTMFSQTDGVLKLTAQLLPVGNRARRLRLDYRPADAEGDARDEGGGDESRWTPGPVAPLESGYVARFRVEGWDSTRPWEYRVVYRDADGSERSYRGRIPAEPDDGELTIALLSCVAATARRLDSVGDPDRPFESGRVGRYTPENVYFPHERLVGNVRAHDADLLVFAGDQFYESSPTHAVSSPHPTLDCLYKWYLWMWAFGDLTRSTPAITLVDDHDVYQPNLWGAAGRRGEEQPYARELARGLRERNYVDGGYVCTPSFVRQVQKMQCSHNPDPVDPRPVAFGIPAYYTDFVYGGVNFALLEDRKFKSPPTARRNADASLELLGDRQERFLADWADRTPEREPTICLTQTCLAAAQTGPKGRPEVDLDSNGFPSAGRDRAVRLLRRANALVLSGDRHLATLVRHGVEGHTDGVVQFNGPAGGTTFQRWFDPNRPLPNRTDHPNTGDFTDAFGNKLRMLAVANPEVSLAAVRHYRRWSSHVYARGLKHEGYGIVRVDADAEAYTIECWPWNEDPTAAEASQFAGWPYLLSFEDAAGH